MRSLADWLAFQERQHPQEIELGLGRVRTVWDKLGAPPLPPVVTIAGTNGKGTTAHALDALARDAGWATGRYTSPHLYRYNERITLNAEAVSDARLCAAFAHVEQARGDTPLTYFEYGTLAALEIFASSELDLAILEVGLGGRLDATNIIDADIAVLCSLALDHQDWLGSTLEQIACEKAGIARQGRPAIVADPESRELYAPVLQKIGAEEVESKPLHAVSGLAPASLGAAHKAWEGLHPQASEAHSLAVFEHLQIPGRMQRIVTAFGECLLDVAHNPAAAQRLVTQLQHLQGMRQCLVLGMQADKDIAGTCAHLREIGGPVFLCDLPGPRGAAAEQLMGYFPGAQVRCFSSPLLARKAAEAWAVQSSQPSRIIIAGSFVTVGECGLG